VRRRNGATAAAAAQTSTQRETLERYCVTCHNAKLKTGGLSLETMSLGDIPSPRRRVGGRGPQAAHRDDASRRACRDRRRSLAASLAGGSRLSSIARRARRVRVDRCCNRLNRAEYGNVIRDLLDLDVDVTSLLPADDAAFGFDNNADLMTVSPALLERYLTAADRVSALAVGDPATATGSETYSIRGDQSQSQHRKGCRSAPWAACDPSQLPARRRVRVPAHAVPDQHRGHTRARASASDRDCDRRHAGFIDTVGGTAEAGQKGTVTDKSDATDARLRVRVPVKAGPHEVTATFVRKIAESPNRLRPFLRSNSDTYDSTGRPHIETVTITGPFNATGPGTTPSRSRIFSCRPSASAALEPSAESRRSSGAIASSEVGPAPVTEVGCARRILSTFARRGYRRPVTEADLTPLLAFYRDGRKKGTFETGIQLALRRLLASPSFVFRHRERPRGRRTRYAISRQRRRACLAALVLSLEQHS
jgi:hypothetical protein